MNDGLSNAARGKAFQVRAVKALQLELGEPFDMEVSLPIGNPPKFRSFDLASRSRRYVGECKAFTWTAGGNTPSAKITTLREASQYLNLLPIDITRVLVMSRSIHPRNREPLADYFARLNAHLIGDVAILELSDLDTLRLVTGSLRA